MTGGTPFFYLIILGLDETAKICYNNPRNFEEHKKIILGERDEWIASFFRLKKQVV